MRELLAQRMSFGKGKKKKKKKKKPIEEGEERKRTGGGESMSMDCYISLQGPGGQ